MNPPNQTFNHRPSFGMASPGTSMRDMTAHVERSESQILEEEVTRLEVRAGPLRHRHCPTPQT